MAFVIKLKNKLLLSNKEIVWRNIFGWFSWF
jgi:hypothetical protein